MDIDDVGLRVEVIVPDILKQHRPGDDLAFVLHHIFQKPEFTRLKDDLLARPLHLMGKTVELQVADSVECVDVLAASPPAENLNAGEKRC